MTVYTNQAFIFATDIEAGPFIETVSGRQIVTDPFPVFSALVAGQPAVILISGMGMKAASAAMQFFMLHYTTDKIVNCGAAGCLTSDFVVGDIVSITDTAILRSGTGIEDIHFTPVKGIRLDAYPAGKLVTVDEPLFDSVQKKALSRLADLVDMEGGVISDICISNNISCQLIKVISDHAEDRKVLGENLQHVSEILSRTLASDIHRTDIQGIHI